MRKIMLLTTAVAALATTSAFAADIGKVAARLQAMPIYEAPAWAGLYVGVNGGLGASNSDQSIAGANALGTSVVNSGFVPSSVATRRAGAAVGGQVGYNYMISPNLLAGVEADLDWTNLGGNGGQSEKIGAVSLTTNGSAKLRWLGTARARLGYLVAPGTLLYGTGGLAFGGVNSSTSIALVAPAPFAATASADQSTNKVGWTLGAGVEQKIGSSPWSVKAEYLYVSLGHSGSAFGAKVNGTPVNFSTDQANRYQIARLGLNYKF